MTDPQTAAAMETLAPEQDTPQQEATPTEESSSLATEVAEWKDRAARLAADMENLRKRTQKEVQDARNFAITGFAKNLLPVADNMERALEAINQAEETEATQTLKEGVAMVAHQLTQAFQSAQIAKMESMGKPLNPEHHQVMAQAPSDQPENIVIQEMQPGYTLAGRLLRPALVIVSTGQTEA